MDTNTVGGQQNLRLDDPAPQRRSEVQIYMTLYYNTRIRPVVVKRWADTGLTNMDFGRSEVPEELVDPKDSLLLKDTKIPLGFKNEIALELYNAEAEEIKEVVQSKREEVKTVYNTSEEDRLDLV